jgi:hypothetical protein
MTTGFSIDLAPDPHRRCGECQLCCRVMPMRETNKPANVKCEFQRYKIGCSIYHKRPNSCRFFVCRWLSGQDTHDQQRPDRSHCVIDPMPDAVYMRNDETGAVGSFQVVQIWVDPKHRFAFRNEPMRSYIERRAAEGIATLIRWSESDGVTVFAPAITGGQWVERGGIAVRERTPEQTITAASHAQRFVTKGQDHESGEQRGEQRGGQRDT